MQWVCFLGRVERNLLGFAGGGGPSKKTLSLWDYLSNPRGKGELLCFVPLCQEMCDFQRSATLVLVWTLLVLNFSQQMGEFEIFLPPPFLLFLFRVNSSCRSNIDKYSRECFSGRRMLPKHFLTIFGKN